MSEEPTGEVVEPAEPAPVRQQRDRRSVAWGAILVIAGIFFLIVNLFPAVGGGAFLLLLGIAFLAAYFLGGRRLGFLIPGGILSGLGIGVLLNTSTLLAGYGGLVVLFLGLGFVFIWVFEGRQYWTLIAGAVLVFIGAVSIASEVYGTRAEDVLRWWPVVLIALGIWLLWRRYAGRTGTGVG